VTEDRMHRAVSADGTEIAGRVRGDGPPLVVLPGGLGDGNPDTNFLTPFLVEHFTCYFMSPRGLGVSADHPDRSRERLFEDCAAFATAIGEPVSMFGHSAGALSVLGGAALAPAVCRSLALYEAAVPVSRPVMHEEAHARFCNAVAEGRPDDAFWILVDDVIVPTDDERALFALPGVADAAAPVFPITVRWGLDMNRPIDPGLLKSLDMPVLLLEGTRSSDHYRDAVRALSEMLDDARVVEIDGAGHMGPVTHPQAVAEELVSFLVAGGRT
jgi:pimeloyl-ACP methyl ester carboxylesterase